VLRGEFFERRLTDRLIEIATEGRGAVFNGWVEPEPTPADEATEATETEATGDQEPASPPAAEADGDADALDRALTLGTMPGQPGDLVETPPAADAAVVGVGDVAGEPDAAQAAAAGHERENAAVAAGAPAEAVTPEEREAQGEPGVGGSLPNPTT
jgi:hypothetical protein